MGRWRKDERSGHKRKKKDQQSKERSPAAARIQSCGVVNGSDTKESHDEKQRAPNVPTIPGTNEPENDETGGQEYRGIAVKPGT